MAVSTLGGVLVFHVFRILPLQTRAAKKEHAEQENQPLSAVKHNQEHTFHRHTHTAHNLASPSPELPAQSAVGQHKAEETDDKFIRKIWILSWVLWLLYGVGACGVGSVHNAVSLWCNVVGCDVTQRKKWT